jgi:hypothetical protein
MCSAERLGKVRMFWSPPKTASMALMCCAVLNVCARLFYEGVWNVLIINDSSKTASMAVFC